MKNTEVHIKRIEKMKKGKAIIVLCFILVACSSILCGLIYMFRRFKVENELVTRKYE